MKFALAFAAAAAAEQIRLPNVSWDKDAIEDGLNTINQYGKVQKSLDENAGKQLVRDLGKTAAYWQTANGVYYAKVVKPYANLWVRWLNAITVDGKCNMEKAHLCVYKHWRVDEMLAGQKPGLTSKAALKSCLKAANCQMNWEKLTPAQQQAAKNKFVNDFKSAVGQENKIKADVGKAIEAKLEKAAKNYENYERVSYAVWGRYTAKFAKDMNCDAKCVDKCVATTKPRDENTANKFGACLKTCKGCYKDVISVDWKPKAAHKLAAIEEYYGPVETLEDEDFQDLAETFEMMNI